MELRPYNSGVERIHNIKIALITMDPPEQARNFLPMWPPRLHAGVRVVLSLLAVAAALAGLRLARSPLTSPHTLARIQRENVIRIGYAVEPPYVFQDARGEPTGCEIEAAKILVDRLGIRRIEWCQTRFGSLIAELLEGRFDVIVAGMFITPERARLVDFSEPTLHVRPALLVRAGNPRGLHAYGDVLKDPGAPVKIAVLQGSVEEALLRQTGVPDAQLVLVPDARTGKTALENGLVDGLALSAPTLWFMAQEEQPGLTELAAPFKAPAGAEEAGRGYTAAVFRKADDDLRDAWNRQLLEFIGTPAHRRLLADFGFSEDELPGRTTTAGILEAGAR